MNRFAWRLFFVTLATALVVFVIFSPMIVDYFFGATTGAQWSRLGDIGQAYGAGSAILSAAALIGVVATFAGQNRQYLAMANQSVRTLQFDILKTVLADPETYWPAMGGHVRGSTQERRRRIFYVMYINYVRNGWETGLFSADSLRNEVFSDFFAYTEAREYWEQAREAWQSATTPTRIGRGFYELIEEAYLHSLKRPAVPTPKIRVEGMSAEHPQSSAKGAACALAVGLVVGVAIQALRPSRPSKKAVERGHSPDSHTTRSAVIWRE